MPIPLNIHPQISATPQMIAALDQEFIKGQGWISIPQGIQLITNPKISDINHIEPNPKNMANPKISDLSQ